MESTDLPKRPAGRSTSRPHPASQARTAPPGPDLDRLRELAGVAAGLIDRAFKTDRALPDRERRWLAVAGSWPPVLHDIADAYGWEPPKTNHFRPTRADLARYLTVMGWVAWLETQNGGARDVKILAAIAHGAPIWKVAARFGRSDETIRRWRGAACAAIAGRFWAEIEDLT